MAGAVETRSPALPADDQHTRNEGLWGPVCGAEHRITGIHAGHDEHSPNRMIVDVRVAALDIEHSKTLKPRVPCQCNMDSMPETVRRAVTIVDTH